MPVKHSYQQVIVSKAVSKRPVLRDITPETKPCEPQVTAVVQEAA